jgi:hypothetical protein
MHRARFRTAHWTAIRTIRIAAPHSDVRGQGRGFFYVISCTPAAAQQGILAVTLSRGA